jgi:hypothetical protein|tara:strand:+ start:977 stop:1486 length:510 start_codon:yes stop_codon:yes gene_type:complete
MVKEIDPDIQSFLTALDHGQREAFLSFVENTYSSYEIWLYAGILGYEGGFIALEKWLKKNYPKLNRREIMLAEIVKIEADIDFLRQQVQADIVKPDAAATRIAHLSKELRGHIVEVERMTKGADRRGLVLSGADKVMRELRSIFKGNDDVIKALDLAYESVWQVLVDER